MKTRIKVFLLTCMLILACSDELADSELMQQPETTEFSLYTFKTYDVNSGSDTVILERIFNLDNGKIESSTNTSSQTTDIIATDYTYENNLISNISSFKNGILYSEKSFNYNSNGQLFEYIISNNNSQGTVFKKTIFIRSNDTIYGSTTQSSDGINFSTNLSSSKIVLDNNNNKTYHEVHNLQNDEISYTNFVYDTNQNLLSYEKFEEINGSFQSTLSFSYTYNNIINSLGEIYDTTFGRELLMLLDQHYELSGNALNNYNTKYISSNCFETADSTFFGSILSAEFSNQFNTDNQSTFSDYKTLANGNLFARFSYFFQE